MLTVTRIGVPSSQSFQPKSRHVVTYNEPTWWFNNKSAMAHVLSPGGQHRSSSRILSWASAVDVELDVYDHPILNRTAAPEETSILPYRSSL